MTIHKEGYTTIFLTFCFSVLLVFVAFFFLGGNSFFKISSIIVSLLLLLAVLQFFRRPHREITPGPACVFSPADGKIVAVEEVHETEYFKDARRQVSVFMSPFNVHVNWNPVGGKVKYGKYHPGKYLVAWHPKSSSENERTTFVVETGAGNEVMFRQIAGAVARRIVYYIKEGDEVVQGEEMGFIKFGSRVDILLPLHAKIKVSIGQEVKGCITLIASFE